MERKAAYNNITRLRKQLRHIPKYKRAYSGGYKTFIVYPNPAKDRLNIQTNAKATFSLTNQSGKILLTKTIIGKGEINVATLPAGVYFLKNNESGVVRKVVVEK